MRLYPEVADQMTQQHWTAEDDAMFREWAGESALATAMMRHPDFADDIAGPVVEACMKRMMRRDAIREWTYRVAFIAAFVALCAGAGYLARRLGL
jgi:aminopeptidase-like protein